MHRAQFTALDLTTGVKLVVAATQPDPRYSHVAFQGRKVLPTHVSVPPRLDTTRVRTCSDLPPRDAERRFLCWLLARGGLDPSRYRWRPLVRRIPACLRSLRAKSLTEARLVLERDPARVAVGVNSLVIGVTQFFRDPEVFAFLEQTLLPRLSSTCLRIWSAGCSDGAELYSMAMLLEQNGRLESSCLLGTDGRTSAIERARRGLFSDAAWLTVPPSLRRRFFEAEGHVHRIVPLLREQTYWEAADVFDCRDVARWDVILCRNLAIYLDDAAARTLWAQLVDALRPGGTLIVGKAERPPQTLGLARIGPCSYRRPGSCP